MLPALLAARAPARPASRPLLALAALVAAVLLILFGIARAPYSSEPAMIGSLACATCHE